MYLATNFGTNTLKEDIYNILNKDEIIGKVKWIDGTPIEVINIK